MSDEPLSITALLRADSGEVDQLRMMLREVIRSRTRRRHRLPRTGVRHQAQRSNRRRAGHHDHAGVPARGLHQRRDRAPATCQRRGRPRDGRDHPQPAVDAADDGRVNQTRIRLDMTARWCRSPAAAGAVARPTWFAVPAVGHSARSAAPGPVADHGPLMAFEFLRSTQELGDRLPERRGVRPVSSHRNTRPSTSSRWSPRASPAWIRSPSSCFDRGDRLEDQNCARRDTEPGENPELPRNDRWEPTPPDAVFKNAPAPVVAPRWNLVGGSMPAAAHARLLRVTPTSAMS